MSSRVAWFGLIALNVGLAMHAVAEPPQESFELRVPSPPMPRAVDGGRELVYELHLANFARRDLLPVRVEVLAVDDGRVLASYDGTALDERLDRSGLQWKGESYEAIPSGRRGVVFVELTLPGKVPVSLRHRVGYVDTVAGNDVRTIEGGVTPMAATQAPVLSPPLEGGPWVAIYNPRWDRGHRRAGYAVGGTLRTPGRHAADWVKLDAEGRKAPAGDDLAARTFSHGQAVFAVGDGRVVKVRDTSPERERMSEAMTGVEGNDIVIALDGGGFAHYGHLRPGSAVVREGARVKASQRIAEVGFSGSASDPQLHFALTDGADEYASEGLAYTFDRYRVLGRYDDVAQIGSTPWTALPKGEDASRKATMPSGMSVLTWDVRSGKDPS